MKTVRHFQYELEYAPNHPKTNNKGFVLKHVLVVEEMLGRHLKDGETVHHIDGNKKNNELENLMVFATTADHTAYHKGARAWSDDGKVWKTSRQTSVKRCLYCNKPFIAESNKKNIRKYCSYNCARKANGKACRIEIENIKEMLFETNGNFSSVAKKLNMSSSGLSKYLKEHGENNHAKDYKNDAR